MILKHQKTNKIIVEDQYINAQYHITSIFTFKSFSMVKIKSHVITYPTRLILKSACNKVEQKQSLYLGIKATQHQISPSSGYPYSCPENTFGYPSTTNISRYQSAIPISASMVNNPSRIHEFLSPTFTCIQSKNFPLTESVLNNRQSHSHIKVMDRQILLQLSMDAHWVVSLAFRNHVFILLSLPLLYNYIFTYKKRFIKLFV